MTAETVTESSLMSPFSRWTAELRHYGAFCDRFGRVSIWAFIMNLGKNRRKKCRGKNGRGEKRQSEEIAEGKRRQNDNLKNNFSATANIFLRNFFFTLTELNLQTSFIRII